MTERRSGALTFIVAWGLITLCLSPIIWYLAADGHRDAPGVRTAGLILVVQLAVEAVVALVCLA